MKKTANGEVYCFGEGLVAHFPINDKDFLLVIREFCVKFTAESATLRYDNINDLSGTCSVSGSISHDEYSVTLSISTGTATQAVDGKLDSSTTHEEFWGLDGKWISG